MLTVLKLAWRSLWRQPRRTLFSLGAVALGLMLIIFYDGLLGGVLGEARDQLDNVGMGHVEITAPGWREHRGPRESLAAPAALLERLGLPPGAQSGARVVVRGLASSARGSEGVELLGVDFARERQLSAPLRDLHQGAIPGDDDPRGLLLGEKLAERLKVKVGSKVRVMAQRADGEIGAELFRVRGIYHSLSPSLSLRRVLVSTAAARELVGLGDEAHQLVIQLDRAAAADGEAARLRAALGPGYEVRSYGELLPALHQMEALADSIVWFVAVFVYALVGLGILNTMLMSVLERSREFAVLRAIGTRPGRVVAQVLGESFWIGTLGAAVGLALGLLLTWYGSVHPLMDIGGATGSEAIEYAGTVMRSAVKTEFSLENALKAASLVYVMALLTGLYPAFRVASLPPARALQAG